MAAKATWLCVAHIATQVAWPLVLHERWPGTCFTFLRRHTSSQAILRTSGKILFRPTRSDASSTRVRAARKAGGPARFF